MKTNVIKHHLADSLKSLRRNGWMTVAAVSAVTVTLLLVGIVMAFLFNINRVSQQVENDVNVRVSINRNVSAKNKNQVKKQLADMPEVTQVTYRSRAKELNSIVSGYGSQWRMFRGDDNPLNDVFLVKAKTPKATMKVAKRAVKLAHVKDADYGGRTARRLFRYVANVRNWGIGFAVMLLLVAIFLISNTIRITILSRRDEIAVMRLVGATSSYIRWPFLLEGAWTGLLGAIIPIVVVNVGYSVLMRSMTQTQSANGFSLYPNMPFLFWIDLLLLGLGIVIGALGSSVSMRRFLKL
ncbi:permease-like cell division protein FtsX [Lacticaseibacillus pabuli]|uniref:Cell division protein FtsX n=1 Tax=Lacticaseibacillus pabuli TaxID=3025672 RepID=A0ABY7WPG2_9LACO|nr:permease-like cell division protein FtsX [Lacticaseibacillus sp. KACC 23028]WDF81991.1 permease-like cell division protein FtsX [Lacticaseibacillus sp. KACC 23028]